MSIFEKPILVRKLHKYIHQVKKQGGKILSTPRQLVIDYTHFCNFKCSFCYERTENTRTKEKLSLEEISRIADEAHELGFVELILQGGELLIKFKELLEIIRAIKPERFKVILMTNGVLIDEEKISSLRAAGVDCIGVSLSTLDETEFEEKSGIKGSFAKVKNALELLSKSEITTWIQVIFGHHNSKSKDLFNLLDYAKEKNIGIYFILAMPYGIWKDNRLTNEDLEIFAEIRKKYNCFHDPWDEYDLEKKNNSGCIAGNRLFITPKGDVLPCPFIEISFGNIREKSLQEIYSFVMSNKWFSGHSSVCLAAQNFDFREKYLSEKYSCMNPNFAYNIFTIEDFKNE